MARADQVAYFREEFERRACFARTVKSRGTLYISGCTSTGADGNVVGTADMQAQLQHVYEILREILASEGLTFEHVVKEMIFTTDMPALILASSVREHAYAGVAPPATTGVQVAALLRPEMLVEIELVAELPDR